MEVKGKEGAFELYEIFKDYNRILILINLYDNEYTIEELTSITGLSSVLVQHQLEYLKQLRIVTSREENKKKLYKISTRTFKILIGNMLRFIEKRRTRSI